MERNGGDTAWRKMNGKKMMKAAHTKKPWLPGIQDADVGPVIAGYVRMLRLPGNAMPGNPC